MYVFFYTSSSDFIVPNTLEINAYRFANTAEWG